MSGPDETGRIERSLRVRPYAMTGGRTRARTDLPLEALVKTTAHGQSATARLTLERKQIALLCCNPLSIAEISAHLSLPLGVARVLVGDMAAEGMVTSHHIEATQATDRPSLKLLERVLDGLQAL